MSLGLGVIGCGSVFAGPYRGMIERLRAAGRAEVAAVYDLDGRKRCGAAAHYDLDPELMWFAHEGRSESGIRAALEVLAGRGDTYLGLDCPVPARQEGRNSLWGFCRIRHRVPAGAASTDQLFGLIIERDGIYKVVSCANKLD